ncbi:hypothetical protein ACE6H2_027641 [Prunus campanulata]
MYSHDAGEEYADVNWDDLKFGGGGKLGQDAKCKAGLVFICKTIPPKRKSEPVRRKHSSRQALKKLHALLSRPPSDDIGKLLRTGLFEGLKAYRRQDGGIQLFRPEQNALRMKNGADRLCMPSTSVDAFVDAVKQTALANKRWVPPPSKGSLYVRPLLLGSGPVLGIGPAPEYTFLIFASPIGNWYKVFEAVSKAKAKGFTDVLYLDAASGKNVEEVSSCNVFIVKGNLVLTPPTNGTILPGITRKSIIEIALHLNFQCSHEADEKYGDAMNWDELEFGVIPTDYMYIMKCSNGDDFSQGHLTPYGKIELSPSAGILNYGQDQDGRIQLFRPEENAIRMKMGAERLCMSSPSTHQFLDALKQTVLANKRWVPPQGKGALYIRPLLFGSGPALGLGPAPEYTFLVYATPVGSYHKGNVVLTLPTNGTILPGITRKSIIEIALHHNFQCSHEADEKYGDAMNWDELEFGVIPTDYMYIMKCSNGDDFSQGHLTPYGKIELSPSAGILNYGQGIFEGLKAIRTKDGRIQLFRPEENAIRMKMGAERLCMPSPSTHQFLDALKQTVLANKRWCGATMNLYIENEVRRAIPGGTGGIKSITNYSPVFEVVKKARAKGFTDVLFLDAATGKNIEEASLFNIFFVKDNVILTPPANGTILPGITRKSIIEIARDLNYLVEERDVPLEDVLAADEVFCTGTAVEVTAVASITYQDKRIEYRTWEETMFHKLRVVLKEIQTGVVEDKMGWTMLID